MVSRYFCILLVTVVLYAVAMAEIKTNEEIQNLEIPKELLANDNLVAIRIYT